MAVIFFMSFFPFCEFLSERGDSDALQHEGKVDETLRTCSRFVCGREKRGLRRPAAWQMPRWAMQMASKTGANSRGPECLLAQFPLGHHAMNEGAKTSEAQRLARQKSARFPSRWQMRREPLACLEATFGGL
nr:hypothetical protein [uncultured Ottowia sp.]